MRLFLCLLTCCFAVQNVKGQAANDKTSSPDTIINELDGKVFLVTLREENNSAEDSIRFEEFRKSFINNRVVLSFINGTLESSWVGSQPFGPCTEALCISNGSFTAFSTYCDTYNGEIKAAWTGIIKRNKVQGIFSWVMQDGSSLKYFFFGNVREKIIENTRASAF